MYRNTKYTVQQVKGKHFRFGAFEFQNIEIILFCIYAYVCVRTFT